MPPIQQSNASQKGEFMNVSERYTLYDTIAVLHDLTDLSKQPPGWYPTFAAFGSAAEHTFFNSRNNGNCDDAYTNVETRDQTAYAFLCESIGLSFWCSPYLPNEYEVASEDYVSRMILPPALWQSILPYECSLTLRVQEDDKLKANALMLSPGYGPVGGGFGNAGGATAAVVTSPTYPDITAQTQGVASPQALFRFPTVMKIPRRASLCAYLRISPYGRAMLAAFPGAGSTQVWDTDYQTLILKSVMFGVTCTLNGARLVQQRGELHA